MDDFGGIGESLPGEIDGRGSAELLGVVLKAFEVIGRRVVIVAKERCVPPVAAAGVIDHHGCNTAVGVPRVGALAVAVVEDDGLHLGGLFEMDGDMERVGFVRKKHSGGAKVHVRQVGGGIFGVGATHLNGVAVGGDAVVEEVGEAGGFIFKPVVEA